MTSLDIILEEAARWDKPFFICGDWNDIPSSTLITKMKKSFRFLSNISNISSNYTFPAGTPNKIIDYIARYGREGTSVTKRQVINEPDASDHRPVLIEISFDGVTPILPISQDNCQLSTLNSQQPIYDLTGKRVQKDKLSPGLYIIKDGNRNKVISVR